MGKARREMANLHFVGARHDPQFTKLLIVKAHQELTCVKYFTLKTQCFASEVLVCMGRSFIRGLGPKSMQRMLFGCCSRRSVYTKCFGLQCVLNTL